MPIGLTSATEEATKTAAQKVDAADAATHNPLALTPRTKSFCELTLALTEKNARTLNSDDFNRLVEEYDKLEGFERYAAGVELSRIGVGWLTTLENSKDGYDDELNGYDVYCQLRSTADSATAGTFG